jgi:hypothetical protein
MLTYIININHSNKIWILEGLTCADWSRYTWMHECYICTYTCHWCGMNIKLYSLRYHVTNMIILFSISGPQPFTLVILSQFSILMLAPIIYLWSLLYFNVQYSVLDLLNIISTGAEHDEVWLAKIVSQCQCSMTGEMKLLQAGVWAYIDQ